MHPLLRAAALALALLAVAPEPGRAAPLPFAIKRASPQDLEVFDILPDGRPSTSRFYSYESLLTLPLVTVQTAEDLNTHQPATYTGVYLQDLFAAFGAQPGQDVLASNCYDHYKDYYDADYLGKHRPILLLKYNGQAPAAWPRVEGTMAMGPYDIVYEKFVPAETIYGYAEVPRIPFGVVSMELTTHAQAFDSFAPKKEAADPEVRKGWRIAWGSCVMCHNTDTAGGTKAERPWSILAAFAASGSDHFRGYVVNPQKLNPASVMPAHPTFDAKTLDALQAYFKTML